MQNLRFTENNFDPELLALSAKMDAFEGYVHPHGRRIAAISDSLGATFHLAHQDRIFLQQAALIHDVGEMVMNREYLQVNRIFVPDERVDMQRHPVIGEQQAAKHGLSRAAQLLIRWHHEWWNGAGYPDGLEFDQIPLAARILRVADTFCALTDARPFRKALSEEEARRYMAAWAGIEFDPTVVKAFLTLEVSSELRSYAVATSQS
jgi:HD-GYP domain-containing protein (c-di-GMP phosphodiesterase class II)